MRHWSLALPLLVALSLLLAPGITLAQADDCPGCELGIYDNPELSRNFGFWDTNVTPLKSIWVGIRYDATVPPNIQELTGIELSIDGIPVSPFPPSFTGIPDPTVVVGTDIRTPDNEISGTGGINMAWNICLRGNRALIRIDMLSFTNVGSDVVIQVRRKFPPASPFAPVPLFTRCDSPNFTLTTVTAGCYVLNPTVVPGGNVADCATVNPPELTLELNRDVLWPPNHELVDIAVTATASPDATVELTSITSNEPDDGLGDGDTANDIQGADFGTADFDFQLRSERSGTGTGRKYTIVYTATNPSGASTEETACVLVPHDQSGNARGANGFLADGTGLDAAESSFFVVIPGSATLDDAVVNTRHIKPSRARIGNHRDEIAPISHRRFDATGDHLVDLVLEYPTNEALALLQTSGANATIALRYEDKGKKGSVVPDLFVLGPPLQLRAPSQHDDDDLVKAAGDPVHDRHAAPKRTKLAGIHPNPFNPSTTVSFDLAVDERVRIDIYSLRGIRVRTLTHASFPVGRHEVTWDGRDDAGRRVSSGVYVFRLETTTVQQTKKAVLMK